MIPTVCWPAFAIKQGTFKASILERCATRLKGKYGFKRFNRDGFATVLDTGVDYQPGELMVCCFIENIDDFNVKKKVYWRSLKRNILIFLEENFTSCF